MFKSDHKGFCCGTTQVGERGQIVIPADARKTMGLKTGDKLITFVKHNDVLVMIKAENIEKIVEKITAKVENLRKALKK